MPETPPTPSKPARKPWSFGQRLIAIGAVAGTAIGVVSVVIPLVVTAGARTTSTETVEVQAGEVPAAAVPAAALEPVQPGLAAQALGAGIEIAQNYTVFSVPVDAPWAELWALQENGSCTSQGQIAWLESHGVEVPTGSLYAYIRNTATSGAELTISEIRAQGELTPPAGDTVKVRYTQRVGGEVLGVWARLSIGVDPVAAFDECGSNVEECYAADGTGPQPGDPVVFTLAPGEAEELHLHYDTAADFTGRLVATVTSGGETSTLDLSPGGVDIVAPFVTRSELFLNIGEAANTYCVDERRGDAGYVPECTLEQWLGMLGS